ncbi:hypothetical protein [Pseudomonas sp. S2_C03]
MASQMTPSTLSNQAYLKMRAEYRSKLVDDLKELIIEDDMYADKTTGLLKGPEVNKGLDVAVPLWKELPPEGSRIGDKIQLQVDRGNGRFEDIGLEVEFKIPAGVTEFPETFPYVMTIDPNDFPNVATCILRYRHTNYQGDPPSHSLEVTVRVDRVPPYDRTPPDAPEFADDFLDDSNLPAGGKLAVTLPGYTDWEATDIVAVYLVAADDIPTDPTTLTPIYYAPVPSPGTADTVMQIDADKIREFGDAEAVLLYVLVDQAQNPSQLSNYKKIALTFGPLPNPTNEPRVPQADPLLTMEKVQEGVSVWVDKYTNYKEGDAIRVSWGSKTLRDFSPGSAPLPNFEIPVHPPLLILEEYGQNTTGLKPVLVSYHAVRSGRLFGPLSESFATNLEVAFPWNPWPPVDWPNPIHPSLLKGDVKNHDGTRTNELTRADKDEDAVFHFKWYTEAKNDQIITFYWGELQVAEARVVFDDQDPTHVPGGDYNVDIPWAYIKETGNGDPILVHYRVTGPGLVNELHSVPTEVAVNAIAVTLPPASFPSIDGAVNPDYPGCMALRDDGALQVTIPDLSGELKDGDKINVTFTPMKGDDLTAADDPITTAIFRKEFTLGQPDSPLGGFDFFVEPYLLHIFPLWTENPATFRRGRVKIVYSHDDGTEVIASPPKVNRTAFTRPNDSCEIPRPPAP